MYERAMVFIQEVRSELSKVSWPTKNELIGATSVVILLSIILGIFIGVIDVVISWALSHLLRA